MPNTVTEFRKSRAHEYNLKGTAQPREGSKSQTSVVLMSTYERYLDVNPDMHINIVLNLRSNINLDVHKSMNRDSNANMNKHTRASINMIVHGNI